MKRKSEIDIQYLRISLPKVHRIAANYRRRTIYLKYSSYLSIELPYRQICHPERWFDICMESIDACPIVRIQSIYRGYRLRQRIREWIAARRFDESLTREDLWIYLMEHGISF